MIGGPRHPRSWMVGAGPGGWSVLRGSASTLDPSAGTRVPLGRRPPDDVSPRLRRGPAVGLPGRAWCRPARPPCGPGRPHAQVQDRHARQEDGPERAVEAARHVLHVSDVDRADDAAQRAHGADQRQSSRRRGAAQVRLRSRTGPRRRTPRRKPPSAAAWSSPRCPTPATAAGSSTLPPCHSDDVPLPLPATVELVVRTCMPITATTETVPASQPMSWVLMPPTLRSRAGVQTSNAFSRQ